jgi:hypothetical protein
MTWSSLSTVIAMPKNESDQYSLACEALLPWYAADASLRDRSDWVEGKRPRTLALATAC